MRIVIPIRKEKGNIERYSLTDKNFSSTLGKGKIRFLKSEKVVKTFYATDMGVSPLVASALMAFQSHLPLRIEPAHFWVTILQEVAMMVKQNPRKYAHVFKGDPDNKEVVKVICDELASGDEHWPLAIERFRGALSEKTGAELVEGFFPHFSDDDATREIAYLVSVMDAASPYYSYEVHTRCGIPEVDLAGTIEDWRSLYRRIQWLQTTFGDNGYFRSILEIVNRIGQQVYIGTPDIDWWKSYFKYNERSGGDSVTGWITDLYAFNYTPQGPAYKDGAHIDHQSNAFPSGLSVVPFVWVLYEERLPMRFFSGLTGFSVKDGALNPDIGYGVIEGES